MYGGRKRWAVVLALALPFVAAPFAMRAVANHVADSIARKLTTLAPKPALAVAEPPVIVPEPAPATEPAAASPAAPAPERANAGRRALFVPSRSVAKLTAAHASRIAGDPTDDGVRLRGVSSLGLGLADGDVLVSVAGQPTRTPDAAIAAVTAAIARHAKQVTGVIRRGGERIAVTVELPPTLR